MITSTHKYHIYHLHCIIILVGEIRVVLLVIFHHNRIDDRVVNASGATGILEAW